MPESLNHVPLKPLSRGLLVSDFNVDNLAAYLRNDPEPLSVQWNVAPFGQVNQILLNPDLPCWTPPPDFLIVWTRPNAVIGAFRNPFEVAPVEEDLIWRDVDEYSKALAHVSNLSKTILVPTWTIPPMHLGPGRSALARGVGVSRLLMQANLRFLESVDKISNLIPLDAARWMEIAGESSFNERLWYSAKIPFSNNVFRAAAREMKAALMGAHGGRKVIVLDLDDVIWGGIVGDIGWENLVLGGHHPMGEAFLDFQRSLKALGRQGVLLAIASKNEERAVWEAFDNHSEMILRRPDFASWRINWRDKAQNIAEIATELNLGLDSMIFIDDSEVERDRVRQALPEVLVPDWPADPRLYVRAFSNLHCFQQSSITAEDRRRAAMYLEEKRRVDSKSQACSVQDWLKTLQIKVKIEHVEGSNLCRATQLLNKTNQMNLNTRRMTEEDFKKWSSQDRHPTWVFSVADRFGDSGLVGILSLELDADNARIIDFVLSCRVMGRKVEEAMLHVAIEWARSAGIREVSAPYARTLKNNPCYEFFQRSGFSCRGENTFIWDTFRAYPLSSAIQLVCGGAETSETAHVSGLPVS